MSVRGVVCAAAWTAAASAFGLEVGFSRVDITPPMGIFMPGYYVDRRADVDTVRIPRAAVDVALARHPRHLTV